MTPEEIAAAKAGHDLSIVLQQHPADRMIYNGWQTGNAVGLSLIENFDALEEWRPDTQELREALHNFLVANEDINKISVAIKEHRKSS